MSKVYLHEYRRNNSMALGEVARALQISAPDLSKMERGKKGIPDLVAQGMAKLYNATVEEIRAGVPSPDEVESDEARMMDVLTAMAATQADAKAMGYGIGKGGRGKFLCPVCKRGQLRYSVAGVNGHIWGKCSTDGCVAWMQ